MKRWDGLTLSILALLSNKATLILAQYVTTVTVSINDNPFCTPVSGIGALGGSAGGASGANNASGSGTFGTSGSGAAGPVSELGLGYLNGSTTSTGSASISSPTAVPSIFTNRKYQVLGYYPAPADGDLLGGPVSTDPVMTVERCAADCQPYPYFALENGNECNCGISAPSGTPSPSPPLKNKRQNSDGACIPCAGNSNECCGAPSGYALVYRFLPEVESSSAVDSSTVSSATSIIAESTTSNSTNVYSTTTSTSVSSSVAEPTTYFTPSILTYVNSSTETASSTTVAAPITFAPITSAPSASSSASGNGSSGAFNSSIDSTSSASSNSSSSSFNYTMYSTGSGIGTGTGYLFSASPSSFGPYSNYTQSNTSITLSTAHLGLSGTQAADTAPTANGGDSGATATTNGGVSATISGGPEPTVESPTPSCNLAAGYTGNNTKYNDYFGFTYDIRCNLDLQSTPTDHDAYAGSFEYCLEYCSLLTDCVAVTYEDPASPPKNSSNCHPKWDFSGYTTSSTDGVYSGVNVNGPSTGTLENQNLCTSDNNQDSSYDGQTYYDDYAQAWTIGCNNTVSIASSAALYPTVTDTLASCVDYCSIYESCAAVNWLGPHTNRTTNDPNCFPASSNGTVGAAGSAPGSAYAVLVPSQ